MTLSSLYGLGGSALLLTSGAIRLTRARRRRSVTRFACCAAGFAAAWLPIDGLPVAAYVRALTGDFAVVTLILLASYCVSQIAGRELFSNGSAMVLYALVATGAVALYPLALGLSRFDPYRLGYDSRVLLAVLSLVALWVAHRGHHFVALSLASSVLARHFGLMESSNLWDYLLDPWLSLYAAARLASRWHRRSVTKR